MEIALFPTWSVLHRQDWGPNGPFTVEPWGRSITVHRGDGVETVHRGDGVETVHREDGAETPDEVSPFTVGTA